MGNSIIQTISIITHMKRSLMLQSLGGRHIPPVIYLPDRDIDLCITGSTFRLSQRRQEAVDAAQQLLRCLVFFPEED